MTVIIIISGGIFLGLVVRQGWIWFLQLRVEHLHRDYLLTEKFIRNLSASPAVQQVKLYILETEFRKRLQVLQKNLQTVQNKGGFTAKKSHFCPQEG